MNTNLFSGSDETGDPRAPASIAIEGPTSSVATYCNGPFIITLKDRSGATAEVPSALSLSLSVSSGGNGLFFSDSDCAAPITSLDLVAGQSTGTFYFKGNVAQGLSLEAAAPRLGSVIVEYTVNANDFTIEVASGDGQSGTVGAAAGSQFVALVKDSMGRVMPDVSVDWVVAAGGGSLSVASSTTSMSGLSSNSYTIGTNLVSKSITATIHGTSTSATFTVSAVPGAAANVSISSGDTQVAAVSSALASPMVVSVTDSYGNAVTGSATINWAITAGGGSLGAATSSVDSSGLASNTLTVGAASGANTVTATLAGSSPAVTRTFSHTATICTGLALTNAPFATSGAGVGDSSGNPFIICTPTQFNQISDTAGGYMSKYYQLGANLSMSGVTVNMIGSSTRPFTGSFDGANFTISGLSLTKTASNVGLFSYASGAFIIKNIRLSGASISASGYDNVAALLGYGYSQNSTINNVHVSGSTIVGRDNVGAISGYTDYFSGNTNFSSSSVITSTVSGRTQVGGAAGYLVGVISQNSVRSTTVTASGNSGGGFAGWVQGTFTKNSAIANVTVTGNYAGGLVGHYNGGTPSESYSGRDASYGTIVGGNHVGGALGTIINAVSAVRLFSYSAVSSAGATKGGLVASSSGSTCTGCFWDTTTSGLGTSNLGYGLATAALQDQTHFLIKEYDFAATWTVPTASEYPMLQWENASYVAPTLASLVQGGAGTVGSPYLVSSAQELKNVALAMNLFSATRSAYYRFTFASPLDMTGVLFGGLGSSTSVFTGSIDGNSKEISNLTIAVPYGAPTVGFVPSVSGAFTIKDLTLTNPTITAATSDNVGSLIGYATSAGSTVQNIHVTGATVTGQDRVGGIIGGTDYWTGATNLTLSTVATSTISGRSYIGGAAGSFSSGTASRNSVNSTNVTATGNYGGGFAGWLHGTATRNSAIANVTVTSNYAGGLLGHWNGGTLSDSYSGKDATYGTVTGGNIVGGAIGYIENSGSPSRIYSTSAVTTAGATKGGLVATSTGGSCTGCFWDTTTSGLGSSAFGTGQDTATMKTAATFASWVASGFWTLVDGAYPALQ